MMTDYSKDKLRVLRARATDLFQRTLWKSVGVSLLYALVSVGLSYLTTFISNGLLAAVMLLVQAFIAASLLLGLCDYFLTLSRGEAPSVRQLARYFDRDSLPMVTLLALISWAAGMLGLLLGGLSIFIQLLASALVFLVPYLYVLRGGNIQPGACLKEAIGRMENRWGMYVRILARQYLYTLAAAIALSIVLSLVISLLGPFLNLPADGEGTTVYILLAVTLVCSVIISAFVMAYFQIYQAEFARFALVDPARKDPPEKDLIV
jgi:hypothetical protein